MQTFSKHKNDSNKDRISNLPSELLCKILSFLESREVVRTCILSSKWRYIWASVPAIRLNFSSFVGRHRHRVFEQFCNNLLLHRESVGLDTFKLRVLSNRGFPSLRTWITDAIKFNPRVVDIDLFGLVDEAMLLPDCIFVCGALEELKCRCSSAPKFLNLPRLRVLEIHGANFCDDFMSKLNSGCPVLEDLTLRNCDLFVSEISSGTLRKLTMEHCYNMNEMTMEHCYDRNEMHISLHTLVFLCLEWCTLGEMGLINLSSLVTATIRQCHESGFGSSGLVKFLGGLSNVKHLSLYGSGVKDMFLKSFSVGECQCTKKEIHILVSFLKFLPNLEKLTLENIMWFSRKCEQLKDVRVKCCNSFEFKVMSEHMKN